MSNYSIRDCNSGPEFFKKDIREVLIKRFGLLHHFPETFKRAKYSLSRQSITNYAYIHKDCNISNSIFVADFAEQRRQVLRRPSGAGGSSSAG